MFHAMLAQLLCSLFQQTIKRAHILDILHRTHNQCVQLSQDSDMHTCTQTCTHTGTHNKTRGRSQRSTEYRQTYTQNTIVGIKQFISKLIAKFQHMQMCKIKSVHCHYVFRTNDKNERVTLPFCRVHEP